MVWEQLSAATTGRKARSTEDPELLRQLMVQAGFHGVDTRRRARIATLPRVRDFVLRHLAATPVAGALEAVSDEVREALADDVEAAMRRYSDGDGVAFPD